MDLYDDCFAGGNRQTTTGTTFHFTNEGQHMHTVTIHWVGDPVTTTMLNQTLSPGQSVSFAFTKAGTFHVWCRFHGTMTSGMAMVVAVT